MKGPAPTTMQEALRLTESNLTSLINAKHSDAVLMTAWRKVVREALGYHDEQPCDTCGTPVLVNAISPSECFCSAECAEQVSA